MIHLTQKPIIYFAATVQHGSKLIFARVFISLWYSMYVLISKQGCECTKLYLVGAWQSTLVSRVHLLEWSHLLSSGKLEGNSVGYLTWITCFFCKRYDLGEYHLSNRGLATSLMVYNYLGWHHHAIPHGILSDSFICIYLYIMGNSFSPFCISNIYTLF